MEDLVKLPSKSNIYKILFYSTLLLLLISNYFLIYKNNTDIKKLNSEKTACPTINCPTKMIPTPAQSTEIFCGGIAGRACPEGYACQLDGSYPDAGGKCIKTSTPTTYSCPASGWVDCMPSPDQPKNYQCEKPFLNWAKANCPNFKGAAL